MNIQAALAHGMDTLTGYSDSPRADAKRLLSHVLRREPAHFVAFGDQVLGQDEENQYRQWLARRKRGEPIAYLTGCQGFWSLDLVVSPGVLIPRPETEVLVETALRMMPVARARVLDLGTGSGAIILSLLAERPNATGLGIDISQNAIQVAHENAIRLGITAQVRFLCADMFTGLLAQKFDLIVSNPPYIAAHEMTTLSPEVLCEPHIALTDFADGLSFYRQIAANAAQFMADGAKILIN